MISRLEYERRIRMKDTPETIAVPARPSTANSGYTAEPTMRGTPRLSLPCLVRTPRER